MITFVDNLLNKITMYRLVLYALLGMALAGLGLSFLGILQYNPIYFTVGGIFITLICLISNKIFAAVFGTPANYESAYITALILILIITPLASLSDFGYWGFLFWASVWAMASKYIFAIGKKHIFNPAAIAVVITSLTINQSASWWVGTLSMAPFVLIGGLLIVRKIRRFDLVIAFAVAALTSIIGSRAIDINSGWNIGMQAIFFSPLIFFGTIMLTEPLTTPPKRWLRILYGALCGLMFSPLAHLGSIYFSPEMILLVGNVFSYFVSPKQKLILRLKEKIKIAENTYDFVFTSPKRMNFVPGQYLEWTISPKNGDSRGNRRYFTIASSPTEKEIRTGVKFYPNGSAFKRKLLSMKTGETLVASQLSGEFIMPRDKNKKLVFLAGGIGITPFRSMIKYMLDTGERRDIIMLYSNKTPRDIAYRDVISEGQKKIGLKNVYTITDTPAPGEIWYGKTGMIDGSMLAREVPDFNERYFYISGTHGMVVAFDHMLRGLGIPESRIKKDFFPGFV